MDVEVRYHFPVLFFVFLLFCVSVYNPLSLFLQEEDSVQKLTMTDSKSALPKSLQDLICMIFDVDQMKKAMMEFEVLFAT